MEKIISLLRDPVWQSIGVISGLITSLVIWERSQRKTLSYEVITKTKILPVPEQYTGRLEVLFDSRAISKPYLVIIKIINSGKIAIEANDYDRAITIGFGEEAEILTFEVIEQIPSDLDVNIRKIPPNSVEEQISVEPVLLNADDSFTIKMLVTKVEGVKVKARIVGIKKIIEFEKPIRLNLIFSLIMYVSYVYASLWLIQFSKIIREIGEIIINTTGVKDYSVLLYASNGLLIIGAIIEMLSVRNLVLVLQDLFRKPRSDR